MRRRWGLVTAGLFALSCVATMSRAQVCNDFDQCTDQDMCSNGMCMGTPISGGTCDDGNECTINDTCASGECHGTPVSTGACGAGGCGVCENGTCVADMNKMGEPCNDGNLCTQNDVCTVVLNFIF